MEYCIDNVQIVFDICIIIHLVFQVSLIGAVITYCALHRQFTILYYSTVQYSMCRLLTDFLHLWYRVFIMIDLKKHSMCIGFTYG